MQRPIVHVAAQIIPQQPVMKTTIQTPQYNQIQAPSIMIQQSGNTIDQTKIMNPGVINISQAHQQPQYGTNRGGVNMPTAGLESVVRRERQEHSTDVRQHQMHNQIIMRNHNNMNVTSQLNEQYMQHAPTNQIFVGGANQMRMPGQ